MFSFRDLLSWPLVIPLNMYSSQYIFLVQIEARNLHDNYMLPNTDRAKGKTKEKHFSRYKGNCKLTSWGGISKEMVLISTLMKLSVQGRAKNKPVQKNPSDRMQKWVIKIDGTSYRNKLQSSHCSCTALFIMSSAACSLVAFMPE